MKKTKVEWLFKEEDMVYIKLFSLLKNSNLKKLFTKCRNKSICLYLPKNTGKTFLLACICIYKFLSKRYTNVFYISSHRNNYSIFIETINKIKSSININNNINIKFITLNKKEDFYKQIKGIDIENSYFIFDELDYSIKNDINSSIIHCNYSFLTSTTSVKVDPKYRKKQREPEWVTLELRV
jgi:hypothetical protein